MRRTLVRQQHDGLKSPQATYQPTHLLCPFPPRTHALLSKRAPKPPFKDGPRMLLGVQSSLRLRWRRGFPWFLAGARAHFSPPSVRALSSLPASATPGRREPPQQGLCRPHMVTCAHTGVAVASLPCHALRFMQEQYLPVPLC